MRIARFFALVLATLIVGAVFWWAFGASDQPAPIVMIDAPYRDASLPIEARVDDLLSLMTLEEKVGQMTLVEKNSLGNVKDVATYGIGAVLSGAGGNPKDNTPSGWKSMVGKFVEQSKATRLGIPILYGVDANHGNGNVPGATIFPHFIGLGAANDPVLTERIARATALESALMGVRWNFSPTLDLPKDVRWGRVYEAFSDDPARVSQLASAYVRGLQGTPEQEGVISVLATAKHFVGIGDMEWGTSGNNTYLIDQGRVPDDDLRLRDTYLVPYRAVIDAGAMSIMTAIGQWGETHIAANKYLLTNVLKGELDFQGFVLSDWYGVYAISNNRYDSTVTAINAGIDMNMLPYDYKPFVSDMLKAVKAGDISMTRIDDAVRRILRVKFALGLFDENSSTPSSLGAVGSSEHRLIAREAVSRSLVLLKNQDSLLPLASDLRLIHVAGSAADNVGMQAGGWTVEWQGIDGNWLLGATSILEGIRETVSGRTIVEYDVNGIYPDNDLADIGIAIVGEKPYAEGVGDNPDPRLSAADLTAIENLRKTSKKVVVIIVSGRPLAIEDELPAWNSLVAAWLPGSEGAGVADVLFGRTPFTGTLPLPWVPYSRDFGLR